MDGAMSNSNSRVAPGDILLLRSRGVRSKGNLLAQAIARRGRARFTHVAVVINENLVADAMPQHGITLRRWCEIQDHYDIDASRVARNSQLADDPDASAKVMQRATYYYKQRYDVKALLRPPVSVEPDGALVCSQFVGALYDDLHLAASAGDPLDAWPHDIDVHTQTGPWRQFKLSEYGLMQGCDLKHRDVSVSAYMPASDTQFSDKISELLVRNLQVNFETSVFASKLADLVATVSEKLQQSPALAAEFAELWQPPGGDTALGGDAMMEHWCRLFLGHQASEPVFLHQQRKAATEPRFIRLYANRANDVLASARRLQQALESFDKLVETAHKLARQGKASVPLLGSMCELAEQLLAWGRYLADDEPPEEVLLRISNYPLLHEELVEIEAESNSDTVALANRSLSAIGAIDLVRLDWVSVNRPYLEKALPRLRTILRVASEEAAA